MCDGVKNEQAKYEDLKTLNFTVTFKNYYLENKIEICILNTK